MTVPKKIYFLADAHLGASYHQNPIAVEKKLTSWLEKIKHDAAAIYFLGDMFDYWYEYRYVAPKGFVRFLGKLAELSDMGIEIHLFTGNHDIWMFDYLPQEVGATIHRDVLTVNLLGKRFFIGHGDEVDYRSRAFRFLRAFFRNPICQLLYGGIHPRWTFGFALRWSYSSRLDGLRKAEHRNDQGEAYLKSFALKYLNAHSDIDFFIFGHIHTLLDYSLSDKARLIIVGDWIKHFSFAEWDGTTLMLRKA
ncbi:MAG: UDP-2,3-diacylglucosamine diphosphatase [Tannerellaceae bacterium]|jgi:UDP-2,3-diacylglucosamine hydrolase|nr:UDP-2,3-diacylglucosamine diphosphatase [Tannerellaceae bacterium]